jgi:RimJ/RimL family protein N-acetyltransferase
MKPILLDLPMPILTPRLMIRPRQVGEGKIVCQAIEESMDSLKPWMPFAQLPQTSDDLEEHCRKSLAEFVLRTNFTLSIYTRDGKDFIGSTGIHRPNWDVRSFHIGYWICKKFEGKGMITESTNALTRYAFEVLRAKRVEIRCDSDNLRSLSVMKRLGFVQEGVLKNDSLGIGGKIRDTIVTARYDLLELPALATQW